MRLRRRDPRSRMVRVRAAPNQESLTCALCREPCPSFESCCGGCGSQVHVACVEELGDCPTLGCSGGVWLGLPTPEERRQWRWRLLWQALNVLLALIILVASGIGIARSGLGLETSFGLLLGLSTGLGAVITVLTEGPRPRTLRLVPFAGRAQGPDASPKSAC